MKLLDKIRSKFKKRFYVDLTWYVEKENKFNYVRVISTDVDSFNNDGCQYRTIEDIVSIENDPATEMSVDGIHLIDVREVGFRCSNSYCSTFLNKYEAISEKDLWTRLEARYREALAMYGNRLDINKANNMSEAERQSQRNLHEFLGFDRNENNSESGALNRNYVGRDGKIRIPQENGRSRTAPSNPLAHSVSGTLHVNPDINTSRILDGGPRTNSYGGTADLSHVGDRATPDQADARILNRIDPEVAMLLEEIDKRNKQIGKPVEEEIVEDTQKKLEKIN